MFKRTKVASGVLAALGGAVLLATAPAMAQTAERVEITGSRIKSIDSFSNSPVTSLGEAELKSTQPAAVEEVVKSLAAATPAIGPGVNNGSGGGATINLRGLGAPRTLVLIDGRRFVPFDLNAQVDTNSVPISLLQRVDVLTGGASAVYGADAIAGVVNFVLKKNFQGIEASTSYGVSEEGDAIKRRMDLTIGSNFEGGKGNVVLSLGRTKTDPLRAGDRPIGQTTTSSATGLFSGSGTTTPVVIAVTPIAGLPAGANTLGTGNRQLNVATGRFDAFVAATGGFNTNPPNYFQTPLDRTQATALANYTINEHFNVYAQFFYTKSLVNSVLAESGTFGNTYNVPIGNAFIPEAARQQICSARGIAAAQCVVGNLTEVPITISRRFVELGPRFNDFDNKTQQATIGLTGDLVAGWTYDAYFATGTADQLQTRRNWGSNAKVQQALRAVSTTTCTNTANGCVPLNVFGATGSITQAQLDFVNLSSVLSTRVKQSVLTATAQGEIAALKSPWAKSPVGLSVGAEQRKVFGGNASDGPSQIGAEVLGTGAATPDRKGDLKLDEVFAEAIVPLMQDKPFARSLKLELGARYTEFTTTSTTNYNTSKVGGDWEPVKGLRFRGMVQKASRAPNVNELYQPQVTALGNLATDPCQGNLINQAAANTAGTLSNLCRLTGVPAAVIGSLAAPSSGQINTLQGGNPNLGPEKADTQTLGLVWEPAFAPGLSVSIDRFRINVTDAISNPSTTDVLDTCYNTAFNPSLSFNAACAAIGRNPANGTLNGGGAGGVFIGQSNQGKIWVGGIDVNASYRLPLKSLGLDPKFGMLDIGFNYTKVLDNDFQATPTSVRRNCIGYYSPACAVANHEQKFNQRTQWTMANWSVGYNWRYTSALQVEPGSGTWYEPYTKVAAYSYVDLNATWDVTKNIRLSLAINNVTDKQPPKVGNTIATTSTNGGETFPSNYDTIGRFYSFGATFKF